MVSILLGGIAGAVVGAIALGTASAMSNGAIGLDIALSNIPQSTHAYSVVSTVRDSLVGGVAGGGIGAAIAAVAKGGAAVP